ncbi:hypothetical protein EV421DRAFT_1820040 [Armillaria borealis]|uniref:Uncharacterized protein n=1 Tax=Armillaria borealis TaxID=47425 RepID=A0AA39JC74_9AGAR|nr:hypothetical protein EV421DRAFT_1820040 [Armillaria borealis]
MWSEGQQRWLSLTLWACCICYSAHPGALLLRNLSTPLATSLTPPSTNLTPTATSLKSQRANTSMPITFLSGLMCWE